MGQLPLMKGVCKIMQLNKDGLKEIQHIEFGQGFKSASFGASPVDGQQIAIGDFDGHLYLHDLEKNTTAWKVKAHSKMVNSIDAIGGMNCGYGAPEIVTGSRDGCVRLWDPRQNAPVLSLEPEEDEKGVVPDCWAVGFGNSFNSTERSIIAGYDNGDMKLFDLKQNSLV